MAHKILLTLVCLAGPAGLAAEELTRAQYVMGTLLRVSLTGRDKAALDRTADAVFDEVGRWDRLLSTYKPDSEVSRINAAAPEGAAVSSDTLRALRSALEWARRTGGAFDPTAGALIRAWGFETPTPRVPEPADVKAALSRVGHEKVRWNASALSVQLPLRGMALNFGAIGKGWALDRALEKVSSAGGADQVVMDFGGQLLFWSARPRVWPAALRAPGAVPSFDVKGSGSLATSAASEHFFTAAGPKDGRGGRPRRYGHILDPRTGYPASACESVTVWAPAAEAADALSTALFVMGPREGLAWADQEGVAARFVFEEEGKGLGAAASRKWKETFEQ